MFSLRPYQQEAVDASINWCKSSIDPCIIVAPTGAGKSLIIAEIVSRLTAASGGKRILITAPSAELVEQDAEKYRNTGARCSIYSSSAGRKELRHPAVFGTPGTIKNNLARFGADYCAVIVDEAHNITPTIKSIIAHLRELNPNLRVIGLTATPYRMGEGYIYAIDHTGRPLSDSVTREPYYVKSVYDIEARMLIERGYLTKPVIGATDADSYDTSGLELQRNGKFKQSDVDVAFCGHGRKTSNIVADIVAKARGREGVMVFCATVDHAYEALASFPPKLSAIVTGTTKKAERDSILRRFKAKELKYLINVSVLTTGFDAPHVDVIALLRATESVSLLQQIIGRGLRINEGKDHCLVLDYADNIGRHCPDGDVFKPEVKAAYRGEGQGSISCSCPECGAENTFSARPNDSDLQIDAEGYFADLAGNRIATEYGFMPAHYGRRCMNMIRTPRGTYDQCAYRWTFKPCPHCGDENDIAARRCKHCKGEIIDPAEKLRMDFARYKKDPTQPQCDEVISWEVRHMLSKSGNEQIIVSFTTGYRRFDVYYHPQSTKQLPKRKYAQFMDATNGGTMMPDTVTYLKNAASGFYDVINFGAPPDEISG